MPRYCHCRRRCVRGGEYIVFCLFDCCSSCLLIFPSLLSPNGYRYRPLSLDVTFNVRQRYMQQSTYDDDPCNNQPTTRGDTRYNNQPATIRCNIQRTAAIKCNNQPTTMIDAAINLRREAILDTISTYDAW